MIEEKNNKSSCQYCFLPYEDCTCCKYCSYPKGTCDCHLEGDDPCTKLHPSDTYKMFFLHPKTCCAWAGIETFEDVDAYVMKMYLKEAWPERLKK